jgi:hypothetical protein
MRVPPKTISFVASRNILHSGVTAHQGPHAKNMNNELTHQELLVLIALHQAHLSQYLCHIDGFRMRGDSKINSQQMS